MNKLRVKDILCMLEPYVEKEEGITDTLFPKPNFRIYLDDMLVNFIEDRDTYVNFQFGNCCKTPNFVITKASILNFSVKVDERHIHYKG